MLAGITSNPVMCYCTSFERIYTHASVTFIATFDNLLQIDILSANR